MKNKAIYLLIIFSFACGFTIAYKFFPKTIIKTETRYSEILKTDTIYIEKINKIYIKAKKDTIYINGTEYEDYFTGYSEPKLTIAYADTSIQNDKLDLNVKYYIEPSVFDINYKIKQLEKVITIQKEPKLFIGTGFGFSIDRKFRLEPSIHLGVYYNLKSVK